MKTPHNSVTMGGYAHSLWFLFAIGGQPRTSLSHKREREG